MNCPGGSLRPPGVEITAISEDYDQVAYWLKSVAHNLEVGQNLHMIDLFELKEQLSKIFNRPMPLFVSFRKAIQTIQDIAGTNVALNAHSFKDVEGFR